MNDKEYWDNKKEVERRKKDIKEHKLKGAKRRLTNIIDKKFQTVTIGALDAFEENFGYLWGHGEDINTLTDEQKEMREDWNHAREMILDNGNSNRRAARNEIDQYTIDWNRYETQFLVQREDSSVNDIRKTHK